LKTLKLITSLIVVFVLILNSTEWSVGNSTGAVAARTGAPDQNGGIELTCQACHGGSLNSGPNTLSLSITDNPQFITAGQTYNLTVSLTGGTNSRGFQIVALDNNNQNTGLFAAGSTNKIVSLAGRQYVTHNSKTNQSWSFTWTAPQTLPENVNFYVSGGTRNANHTYTISRTITANPTSIEKNAVNEGIKLYPSLVDRELFIQSGNASNPLNSWTIVDHLGKTISKGQEDQTNFSEILKIEMPFGMKSGLYSVIMEGPNGKTLKRFIKK
jgi:hypothetical protein